MGRLLRWREGSVLPPGQVAGSRQDATHAREGARRRAPRAWLVLWVGLGALAAAGCGERRVAVSGQVTVDGKPLTSAACTILFAPDKGNPLNKIPAAALEENGVYHVSTGAKGGMPPGWYRVYVAFDARQSKGKPPPSHPRYLDAARSPLSIEVVENPPPGAYDLKLTEK
jgi:hypothetical protein